MPPTDRSPFATVVPCPTLHPRARAGFVINALVVLLFFAMAGLIAWQIAIYINAVPANYPFKPSVISSFITKRVLILLFVAALAGGIGAGSYFAFGRSETAANAGMGVVMLLGAGVFGYQVYNFYAGGATARPAAAPSAAPVPGFPPSTPPASGSQPAPRDSRPAPPIRSQPAPSPALSPTTPAPARGPDMAAAQPVLDAMAAELDGLVRSLIASLDALAPDLAKPPAHDLTRVKSRSEAIAAVSDAADALAKRLHGASDELFPRLQAAGMSEFDARTLATRWATADYRVGGRAFGAESIVRLCDKAKEECEFLRDNFGKWTLDSKGEVRAQDFEIRSKAHSLRFFVKSDIDRRAHYESQLQGH